MHMMASSCSCVRISRLFRNNSALHCQILPISAYYLSSRRVSSISITYSEYGDPAKVLKRCKTKVGSPGKGEVLIKLLAAPVNPADINMVQGVYPIKPPLPAIGGNEGVGEVVEIGDDVNELKPGDWVIPNFSGWGTWRTLAVSPAADFKKIANTIDVLSAATIAVNPCTAYRMLKDFANLQPGDSIIQNGANSGVGQAVIQIAAAYGLQSINVVRDRPDIKSLSEYLKSIGATHVITEETVRGQEMRDILKLMPKPKLGLNCVGGKNATELIRNLDNRGTLVTYGGMSKQPVIIPTSALIFKDIRICGFWMTRWNSENVNSLERSEMLEELTDMIRNKKLVAPLSNLVNINDYEEAISKGIGGLSSEKQILIMDPIV